MFHQGELKEVADKFVDSNCRVYKNWDDFLENNQLPEGKYCYPRGGVYDGDENDKVILEFGKTPASNFKSKLFSVLDIAGTVIMVSSMVWLLSQMYVYFLTQSVQPFVCLVFISSLMH
jgi:hypothetical protein